MGKARKGGKRKSVVAAKGRKRKNAICAPPLAVVVDDGPYNDVPPRECICGQNVLAGMRRYKPHLCPIEPVVRHELYSELHGKRANQHMPALAEEQVRRRLEAARLAQVAGASERLLPEMPLHEVPRATCEAMLGKYAALLERHKGERKASLAPVYSRAAALHTVCGQLAEAVAAATVATELDLHYSAGWFQRAQALYLQGRLDAAAAVLLSGLRHNPACYRIKRALDRIRELQGELFDPTR